MKQAKSKHQKSKAKLTLVMEKIGHQVQQPEAHPTTCVPRLYCDFQG